MRFNSFLLQASTVRGTLGDRPVVGITGSYGKTTTKDLVAHGLGDEFSVVSNLSSFNVSDGILSTMSRVTSDTDVVVQELGASRPRSLEMLIATLLPTVGVITAIADDHWSAFKSRENVLQEKWKLVRGLPADGIAVLNIDDPLLRAKCDEVHCNLVTFGEAEDADVRISDVSAAWPERLSFNVTVNDRTYPVKTWLVGAQQVLAASAAVAIAYALGADLERFLPRLIDLSPLHGRMQPVERADGLTLVMDSLKASPYMLEHMYRFLDDADVDRKYLVVGQLSDTNKKSGRLVRALARASQERGFTLLMIGDESLVGLRRSGFGIEDGAGVFADLLALSAWLSENCTRNDLIVVKTSSNFHFERLLLEGDQTVRCRARSCGNERGCGRCEELRNPNPFEFKHPGVRRSE